MTPQEAYDGMRAFYLRPDTMLGRKFDGTFCEYVVHDRTTGEPCEQARCAVGCLLPMDVLAAHGGEINATGNIAELLDEAYRDDRWGERVFEALGIDPYAEERTAAEGELFGFLEAAQGVHDNANAYPTKTDVIRGLDELAESCGLRVGGAL